MEAPIWLYGGSMNDKYQQYQACNSIRSSAPQATIGSLLPTPPDIEGPFYLPGAPVLANGVLDRRTPGLVVTGRVLCTDGTPAPHAFLDVWQADENGVYDETGFRLRGKITVLANGWYEFKTIVPGDYKISGPGQPDDFRCAHIHVKVTADGCKPLTTQLYFPDDPYNKTDHWFDARRVIQKPAGIFDFVLEPSS